MLYKHCSGCGKRIPSNIVCECQVNNARKRYKEYYKNRRSDREQQAFYRSKEWLRCRQLRVTTLLGIDWYEYYVNNKLVQGYTLHHIEELKECEERTLDTSNLIYLTQANHIKIHKEYAKSFKDKKRMQNILFKCLEKAKDEFGIG